MNSENRDISSNTKKKKFLRRFIIPAVIIFLCIFAGLIYRAMSWEPKPNPASEIIIREAAAKQLSTDPNNPLDPNELSDEDFAKITRFTLGKGLLIPDPLDKPILISDIKLLKKFINLETLDFDYLNYTERAIPKWKKFLVKIGIIDLSKKSAIDLSPLKKLSNLKELKITRSNIKNIEPLSFLAKIERLNLAGTVVSDLKPLRGLKNLQTLYANNTQVFDIEPLKELINLRLLELSGTHISNLEPIKHLSNLMMLMINGTQVSDLESIKNLNKLQQLYLQGTPISDLKPLMGLYKLKRLYINNCPNITDEQIEDLQKVLPNCEISR